MLCPTLVAEVCFLQEEDPSQEFVVKEKTQSASGCPRHCFQTTQLLPVYTKTQTEIRQTVFPCFKILVGLRLQSSEDSRGVLSRVDAFSSQNLAMLM